MENLLNSEDRTGSDHLDFRNVATLTMLHAYRYVP